MVDDFVDKTRGYYLLLLASGLFFLGLTMISIFVIISNIYGRYEFSEIAPTEANMKKIIPDKSANRAAILYSKYTQSLFPEGNTWQEETVEAWKKFLSSTYLEVDIVDDKKIESGDLYGYKLIALPSCKALSNLEILHLKNYVENGGSIFVTGSPGTFDKEGNWRGWNFLTEVLGLEFSHEVYPESNLAALTIRGGLAITPNIPTGYAFKVATWDRPLSCKIVEPRTMQASFWTTLKTSEQRTSQQIEESSGIVFGKYGNGRFIWMGFELRTITGVQEDYVYFDKFFQNCISWLTHIPTVIVKDWPSPYRSAATVAPFLTGDSIAFTQNLLDIVEKDPFPITFFVDPHTARKRERDRWHSRCRH